jgi:isocitrate dehydrogenase (NAD+)
MTHTIAVIRGDGIGPEIMDATLRVLDALQCGFQYEFAEAGLEALEKHGTLLPEHTLEAIAKHRVALKSPLTTPVGEGFSSINVELRKRFDLYANVRPAISFPGTKSRYENIDLITVRENTEGAYIGEGQALSADGQVATLTQKITRRGSERIARYAFDLARKVGRKKVTVVHKANILKSTSGLFLRVAREVAAEYPDIQMTEMIVDNCCMQLVMNPHQFDVIVTTNLFGDIISDLCAGLVGGLGLAPGANIGTDAAIFEAVHGSAPDIAGQGIANPVALLLGAAQMQVGRWQLRFEVADYFRAQGVALPEPPFLDVVQLDFGISDADARYHVPLLVSPWSYSTYRGS